MLGFSHVAILCARYTRLTESEAADVGHLEIARAALVHVQREPAQAVPHLSDGTIHEGQRLAV